MQLLETYIVTKLEKPIRFQEYSVGIFNTIPTKSGIKKAIKRELIFINGGLATTSKLIYGGENIELFQSENSSTFERLELNLEVLFEDDYLAIIYKPAGILVSGNKFVTIANGLSQNLKKSKLSDAVKPQPIHRLDYATSGILLVGKTSTAMTKLGKLFENQEEFKRTLVVEMTIETASAKVRDVGVADELEDYKLDVWAGLIPMKQVAGYPISDEGRPQNMEIPQHILDYYEANK
jgi:23S rRNA-/tRNA-specific pseudouridylate synthase